MRIEINHRSGKPTYLQIVEQVQMAVASGLLRAGDQLPSIRELAEQLRVNRNTIARAYTELEHLGVTDTRQGLGVFISDRGNQLTAAARRDLAREAIDAAIVQARNLGLTDDDFLKLVEASLKSFSRRRGEEK